MELYNAQTMPLSNNSKLKEVQEKILRNETLSVADKTIAPRDHPIKELNGYILKPDHVYRAIDEETLKLYQEKGFICGHGENDEYMEYYEEGRKFNNNKGVNWYLGGVSLKYGNIILECPADKKYFQPAFDNGNNMSYDPTVKFFKSSGSINPVPISMISNIFFINKDYNQYHNENKGKIR